MVEVCERGDGGGEDGEAVGGEGVGYLAEEAVEGGEDEGGVMVGGEVGEEGDLVAAYWAGKKGEEEKRVQRHDGAQMRRYP